MDKIAVFSGSFDPFTLGHYEIAERASALFDRLVIAVADDPRRKSLMFSASERVEIARRSVSGLKNVAVVPFTGFLTDFMRGEGIRFIVRGLRDTVDFEYERSLLQMYRSQLPEAEGFYLFASPTLAHISSSYVRETLSLGGDAAPYVRPEAIDIINSKKVIK